MCCMVTSSVNTFWISMPLLCNWLTLGCVGVIGACCWILPKRLLSVLKIGESLLLPKMEELPVSKISVIGLGASVTGTISGSIPSRTLWRRSSSFTLDISRLYCLNSSMLISPLVTNWSSLSIEILGLLQSFNMCLFLFYPLLIF